MSAATPGQAPGWAQFDALERVIESLARVMYAATIDIIRGEPESALRLLDEQLDGWDGAPWNTVETGTQWLERTRDKPLTAARQAAVAAQEPHAADGGRSFEDMLADPREQFDLRSELLASISEYAAAPPASAGIKPWHPDGVPQPAPGLAALRQAAARELVTAADRDQLSAELGKLKQLLDDFTHAVIDLDDGARLVKAAHAVREKAGLPVIDQFSHPAGPPS